MEITKQLWKVPQLTRQSCHFDRTEMHPERTISDMSTDLYNDIAGCVAIMKSCIHIVTHRGRYAADVFANCVSA